MWQNHRCNWWNLSLETARTYFFKYWLCIEVGNTSKTTKAKTMNLICTNFSSCFLGQWKITGLGRTAAKCWAGAQKAHGKTRFGVDTHMKHTHTHSVTKCDNSWNRLWFCLNRASEDGAAEEKRRRTDGQTHGDRQRQECYCGGSGRGQDQVCSTSTAVCAGWMYETDKSKGLLINYESQGFVYTYICLSLSICLSI